VIGLGVVLACNPLHQSRSSAIWKNQMQKGSKVESWQEKILRLLIVDVNGN